MNDDIYAVVEAAELDEDQEKRLEQELGRQYHLITRDDRLDTIAKDIVRHFLGRGFQGKAMVVSIDKATALRMHDKVQTHWQAERARVETELAKARSYALKLDLGAVADLEDRLHVLTTTDMALVVSPAQNEIEQMRQLGLDSDARRHITATATQGILCGRPHNVDYIHLYRGDREALAGSLDRIQRAASVILKAVSVGG